MSLSTAGFLARATRGKLGRWLVSVGLGATHAGPAPPANVPGCMALGVEPTAALAIAVEPTASLTLTVEDC